MSTITIDESKCSGCTLCAQVCLYGNFAPGKDGKSETVDGMDCVACGHCIAACPSQAITHAALDITAFELLDRSVVPGYDQLLALLKSRRSRREFKDQPLPDDVVQKLLSAAVEAPSSLNQQSVQYTVITNPEVLTQIQAHSVEMFRRLGSMLQSPIGKLALPKHIREGLSKLMPMVKTVVEAYQSGRDVVTYSAPCLILLHAPKTDMFAPNDATFNAENILLAAETLGLGACVLGFVTEPMNRNKTMKALAQVPSNHKVFVAIAIGHPRFMYKRTVPKLQPKVRFVS